MSIVQEKWDASSSYLSKKIRRIKLWQRKSSMINGRMYNTDTTEVLGSWDNGYPRGDFSFEEQTLHKKKTGEYFVYASGGAQSNFGDCYGGHDCSGEKFIPMSVEQAQQWSEEYLTVEKYVEIWGEPEE